MNQRHMPPSEERIKMASAKQTPITPYRIEALLSTQPESDFSRAEIAKLLGRKKTAHLIRVIEQAVDLDLICKSQFQPGKGRPFFVYSYTEMIAF
jgi:predicted transcriptional regulator